MKKPNVRSRRASLRRAMREDARRAKTGRMKIRRPSASPKPWNYASDNCKFLLFPETSTAESAPDAINPMKALNAAFRKYAGWTELSGREPDSGRNYILIMRRPAPEYVAGSEFRFVAVDPETYRGSAGSQPELLRSFWEHQINGRPFSTPFIKSGPVIWKKLGIKVSTETVAYMMGLESIDAETAEAINASILSTFNTAASPVDIESVVFALATFINADPLRKHLHSAETFAEPYGDRTVWALKGFLPDAEDDNGGEGDA
jgi:hypothetical protein